MFKEQSSTNTPFKTQAIYHGYIISQWLSEWAFLSPWDNLDDGRNVLDRMNVNFYISK